MRLYDIAVGTGQSDSIAVMGLQQCHDIFIDITGIDHGYNLQCFGIRNPSAFHHLLGNSQLGG